MKLPQFNKVYFFHTRVLSALSGMEISPTQGNARGGQPGSEGGGGRKRSPVAAKASKPSAPSCFLGGLYGPHPRYGTRSCAIGTGQKRVAPYRELFDDIKCKKGPDENRKLSSSSLSASWQGSTSALLKQRH